MLNWGLFSEIEVLKVLQVHIFFGMVKSGVSGA